MGPGAPSPVWDWSRVIEGVGGVVLVTTAVLATLAAVGAVAVWALQGGGVPAGWRRRGRWWLRHRAARAFASAVADGNLAVAEIQARRLLRGNDLPDRARSHSWDERIILECPWPEAVAQAAHLDTLATLFPTTRTLHDDGTADLLVGRHRRVHLRVLSEELTPGEGLRFAVDAGGSVVRGHLTMLPIPPVVPSASGGSTEVWVHVEGPRGRRARRALRAVRSTTHTGLRRWARTVGPA